MAKKNKEISFETDVDTLVKIEFDTINGKPYLGQITDDELLYLWVQVFRRSREELFGSTSTKSLTRNVRAIFKLKVPTKLQDIYSSEHFTYEKYLDDGSCEEITGRILGYNSAKPAELGDVVRVTIKTNFGIEPEGILNWLKRYGTLTSHPNDYQINPSTGLRTDVFEAEIVLRRHIEEYLPIYGQKAQVNYPGIPRMCNRCFVPGHLRRDCSNIRKDWIAYVAGLLDDGLDVNLVGSWKNAVNRWRSANKQAPN